MGTLAESIKDRGIGMIKNQSQKFYCLGKDLTNRRRGEKRRKVVARILKER